MVDDIFVKLFDSVSKHYKKINIITFSFLLIFSGVGIFFGTIFIHELSHEKDLAKYSYDSETCLFVKPESWKDIFNKNTPIGYYSYRINKSIYGVGNETLVEEEVAGVRHLTEKKAYTITFIIMAIGIISLAFQTFEKFRCRFLEMVDKW